MLLIKQIEVNRLMILNPTKGNYLTRFLIMRMTIPTNKEAKKEI